MKTSQGLQKDVRTTGELNSNLVRLCLRGPKRKSESLALLREVDSDN